MDNYNEVTQLLSSFKGSNSTVLNVLLPVVYRDLRQIADRLIYSERDDHTLNPTALIHETYLKLVNGSTLSIKNRSHLLAVSAKAMRQILIDYARMKATKKRGGDQCIVTFAEEKHTFKTDSASIIALDKALTKLNKINQRQAQIIECWFFGGLSHNEIAETLDLSLSTIRRDWRMARAWLSSQLT